MAALAVSVLLLAAVASVFVGTSKIVRKNLAVDQAVANTRVFQENFVHDVSMAVTSPTNVAPQYSLDSGSTPARSSRITYRTLVGPVAKTNGVSAMTGSTIILTTPAGLSPKTGDYVLCANPDFGAGVAVSVSDTRAPNTQGDVTLTLVGTTIAAAIAATGATPADIPSGTSITIQRQSAYQTAPSAAYPGLYEMRRYPTTARNAPPLPGDTEAYTVISSNLSPASQYPFIQVAGPSPSLAEPGIGWQFSYAVPTSSGSFIGGAANYYEANHTEGVMMPKSGDPMNSMGNSTQPPPPCTTTSTSTTSTSTTSTSTSTSISTTTTTSISTTTSTTSTSTTSISTSSTTSTSTVPTTTTTTTSISTSSISTTTSSSISTSSTTSTSTAPTTTTSVSTTTTTTSSTTSVPTTTSTTTSTTSIPTTTTTTTTSTSSTSSTTTTSTIVYDG